MMTVGIRRIAAFTAFMASMALLGSAQADTMNKETNLVVSKATKAVEEFQTSPVSQKFYGAINKAKAVLIVPEYKRAGIALGGEGGTGVLLKRIPDSSNWTYPAFFEMGGPTLGAQAGFEEGALLVVIYDEQTLKDVKNGELTFGAEARAVAGSKGVQVQTTRAGGHEIDLFIRSKGVFAGAILKGGDIRPVEKLNAAYYGGNADAEKILRVDGLKNPQADGLRAALSALTTKSAAAPIN